MKTRLIALPALAFVATLSTGGHAYTAHEANVATAVVTSNALASSAYTAFDRRISGKKGIQYRRSPTDGKANRSYSINESKKSHRPPKPGRTYQDCGLTPNKSRKPGVASYRVSTLGLRALPSYSF